MDIAEKMKLSAHGPLDSSIRSVLEEGAGEIERLREALELIRMTVGAQPLVAKRDICNEIHRLTGEALEALEAGN